MKKGAVLPQRSWKNSRRPRNGHGRGLPKKGGAGGKGVWGLPGSELLEEYEDINDPNFDTECISHKDIELKAVIPEVSAEEFLVKFASLVLINDMFVFISLSMLNRKRLNPLFLNILNMGIRKKLRNHLRSSYLDLEDIWFVNICLFKHIGQATFLCYNYTLYPDYPIGYRTSYGS